MKPAALLAWAALMSLAQFSSARADNAAPLILEAKIPLGSVSGRIDHMAVDLKRQRLFIAELGNNSVGIVDLAASKVLRRIAELNAPQGVGYDPTGDFIYVANASDGAVRLFKGDDLSVAGRIDLGSYADNVRVAAGQVMIGHSSGALAIIDATTRKKGADTGLPAHPEGFQIAGDRIFVNLPDARQIAVIDRVQQKQVAAWRINEARGNFPMALDHDDTRVIAVFRDPASLIVFDARSGSVVVKRPSCGDADDVFADAKRSLIYVSCGAGFIEIFDARNDYAARGRVTTIAGARTSLFVPELDRLYVAARASGTENASIWVFRPIP